MSQEIVSWRIDGTDENIIPAMASDAETGTHVVLVVDASGSMRKDDVSGYPSRTSAVYDCLVKDFLTPQLQLLAGRGGGESSAIVTLIEMSDAATVIFEREPLYASLEGLFRQQMRTTARNHGNYLPGKTTCFYCSQQVTRVAPATLPVEHRNPAGVNSLIASYLSQKVHTPSPLVLPSRRTT